MLRGHREGLALLHSIFSPRKMEGHDGVHKRQRWVYQAPMVPHSVSMNAQSMDGEPHVKYALGRVGY
ncbi:hypothetical protein VTH06DRAFT_2345 [Thermothelomyces fergusii]